MSVMVCRWSLQVAHHLIALVLTIVLAVIAAPLGTEAQQPGKVPTIGDLGLTPSYPTGAAAFTRGLSQFGYIDGRNMRIEYRQAGGRQERLAELATDLVRHDVDVIFARGAAAIAAAKTVTSTIPIVALDIESDPVAMGFVKSLARPGGNITGVFLDLPELSAKQLQLLKESIPQLTRVAVLGDPVFNAAQFRATEVAARALGLQLQNLEVRAEKDIVRALEAARRGQASAVVVLASPLISYHMTTIGVLAIEKRLAVVSQRAEFAEAGSLIAYGPSLRDALQRCGAYVARILQGARSGDLPVERPMKFEFVINMKTAKVLELTIPQSVILRADHIIE